MLSALRMCQPLPSSRTSGLKLGGVLVVAALAGCSADVSRFDLGSPQGAERDSYASAKRDANFGSSAAAEQGRYQRPPSYPSSTYNSGVARSDLTPPQEQTVTTAALQPDPYASGRYAAQNSESGAGTTLPIQPADQSASSYAPIPSSTGVQPSGELVEVQQGDTLYGLSRKHGTSVSELMAVNNLTSPHLKLGQKLSLPSGAHAGGLAAPKSQPPQYETAAAPSANAPSDWGGSYTVKQGDSLYTIARQNNVKLADLQRYNGIADVRKVQPGTVLKVPGQGYAPATVGAAAAASAPPSAPQSNTLTASSPGSAGTGQVPPIADASSPPATSSSRQPTIINSSGQGAEPSGGERVAKADTPSVTSDAAPQGSVAGSSKLRWPVVGKVVSGFGPRPDGTHNDGVNVAAPIGTDVHAADAGVVAYAGDELKGYGNLVLLRHDNGWVTAYAHADEVIVKRGDRVKRGQIIAKAGRTGQVDQPQVHFELRQGQKPVDPTPFMEKM